MDNDVNVTLTVLSSQLRETKKIITYQYYDIATDLDNETTMMFFKRVIRGNLPFLKQLKEAGIAYSSRWESNEAFDGGISCCRYTDKGEAIAKIIYDHSKSITVHELMERIDDLPSLVKRIQMHHDHITVLPWDNQETYGRIYRTLQLITPVKSKHKWQSI